MTAWDGYAQPYSDDKSKQLGSLLLNFLIDGEAYGSFLHHVLRHSFWPIRRQSKYEAALCKNVHAL